MLAPKGVLDVSGGCTLSKSIFLKSAETGRPIQIIHGCGRRYDCQCPVCANKWRLRNRKRFRQVMNDWAPNDIRMLTLTLRKDWTKVGLDERVLDLWKYRKELFRYLRDMGYWIGGWVACVELPNHIHIVMESDFIPHKVIKEKWQEITKDSFYVFINQWDNVRDMKAFSIFYITKYITKLANVPYMDALALTGFHLVNSQTRPGPREKKAKFPREKWIRIDRLEFEAIFLDFYSEIPELGVFAPPPPDIWDKFNIASV